MSPLDLDRFSTVLNSVSSVTLSYFSFVNPDSSTLEPVAADMVPGPDLFSTCFTVYFSRSCSVVISKYNYPVIWFPKFIRMHFQNHKGSLAAL